MKIGLHDLKEFQTRAAIDILTKVQEYPSEKFRPIFNRNTGELEPFVCRLKAITGAGKTPILAVTAGHLKNGIVLWTTSRGAIVSQTYRNLRPEGKYEKLLPPGTNVYLLNEMSTTDWTEVMMAKDGLTILLATVASFNQTGDSLLIHRRGVYGTLSRWEMLSKINIGNESRHRDLYVFYDEGHGATVEQFRRLVDIKPRAFVLASASPFPSDLAYLLSGETAEEKEMSLITRTVSITTKKVVDAGLLKTRLYFTDCNTSTETTLKEANSKLEELTVELNKYNESPIMCCIVNSSTRGVDVWEALVKIGVRKEKIAVHLNGAKEIAYERYGSYTGIVDTYTGKSSANRSPQKLKDAGYTHIIWNLTLREGWDEPFAYIGYIDGRGRSETDMVQKLGRFIRQPNAQPFDNPDLNSAYFYFNIPDKEFTSLIERTQRELEVEGYEVIRLSQEAEIPSSIDSPTKVSAKIPAIWMSPGNPRENDEIILKNVSLLAESECKAKGRLVTRVIEVAKGENDNLKIEEERDSSGSISTWDFIATRLQRIDSRIVNRDGSIFTNDLRIHPKMVQQIQWGSPAISYLENAIATIRKELENQIRLSSSEGIEVYNVPKFKLISPNIKGVGIIKEDRYKLRKYKNSVHNSYNGLNSFEVDVANALDKTGKLWCRNPSVLYGYGIPIPMYGVDSATFRPDFILWGNKTIWAIDPKGKFLLEGTLATKMLDICGAGLMISFILDGAYKNSGDVWVKDGSEGYTLIRKYMGGVKERIFRNLDDLMAHLD